MQAIQTKYLPCTDTKPTRIKAWCQAGSHTWPRDSLNERNPERDAAERLAKSLFWSEKLIGGTLPGGDGCFVLDHAMSRD